MIDPPEGNRICKEHCEWWCESESFCIIWLLSEEDNECPYELERVLHRQGDL